MRCRRVSNWLKASPALEAVVQRHAHCAGQMIVAGPRGTQRLWCARHELIARSPARTVNPSALPLGSCETVEAMLSLDEHFHQVALSSAGAGARSRLTHSLQPPPKLGACSCMAIHQAEKYARARRLADGRAILETPTSAYSLTSILSS